MLAKVGEDASSKSGHEHLRTGVQRVDHHFPVDRPGNFHPAVTQNGRYRIDFPGLIANRFGLWQKVRKLAGIEPCLTRLARRQQLFTLGTKAALKTNQELQCPLPSGRDRCPLPSSGFQHARPPGEPFSNAAAIVIMCLLDLTRIDTTLFTQHRNFEYLIVYIGFLCLRCNVNLISFVNFVNRRSTGWARGKKSFS